jgi:hypothetical protein
LINETLSAYLDAEQEKAQAMFPHYFEQHKSDGKFGIYVGASLVEDGKFDRCISQLAPLATDGHVWHGPSGGVAP